MEGLSNYCEISLNHSQFESNDVIQVQCNSTVLRLQAIRNESECYTTQLTILRAGPFFYPNGGSIQCRVGFAGEILIDTVALTISSSSKCHKPKNTVPGSTELASVQLIIRHDEPWHKKLL